MPSASNNQFVMHAVFAKFLNPAFRSIAHAQHCVIMSIAEGVTVAHWRPVPAFKVVLVAMGSNGSVDSLFQLFSLTKVIILGRDNMLWLPESMSKEYEKRYDAEQMQLLAMAMMLNGPESIAKRIKQRASLHLKNGVIAAAGSSDARSSSSTSASDLSPSDLSPSVDLNNGNKTISDIADTTALTDFTAAGGAYDFNVGTDAAGGAYTFTPNAVPVSLKKGIILPDPVALGTPCRGTAKVVSVCADGTFQQWNAATVALDVVKSSVIDNESEVRRLGHMAIPPNCAALDHMRTTLSTRFKVLRHCLKHANAPDPGPSSRNETLIKYFRDLVQFYQSMEATHQLDVLCMLSREQFLHLLVAISEANQSGVMTSNSASDKAKLAEALLTHDVIKQLKFNDEVCKVVDAVRRLQEALLQRVHVVTNDSKDWLHKYVAKQLRNQCVDIGKYAYGVFTWLKRHADTHNPGLGSLMHVQPAFHNTFPDNSVEYMRAFYSTLAVPDPSNNVTVLMYAEDLPETVSAPGGAPKSVHVSPELKTALRLAWTTPDVTERVAASIVAGDLIVSESEFVKEGEALAAMVIECVENADECLVLRWNEAPACTVTAHAPDMDVTLSLALGLRLVKRDKSNVDLVDQIDVAMNASLTNALGTLDDRITQEAYAAVNYHPVSISIASNVQPTQATLRELLLPLTSYSMRQISDSLDQYRTRHRYMPQDTSDPDFIVPATNSPLVDFFKRSP